MSFQAYLDAIETKTGLTPRQLVEIAHSKGFDDPKVKAGTILEWLKDDYALGRGHGMALVHVIKNGPQISSKHVGSDGPHRDASDTLWLDGKATNPRSGNNELLVRDDQTLERSNRPCVTSDHR